MLWAHLEITGGALRIYEGPRGKFGLIPRHACTLVGHEGLAILKGMVVPAYDKQFGAAMIGAVRDELRRVEQFNEVTWNRYDPEGELKRVFRMPI